MPKSFVKLNKFLRKNKTYPLFLYSFVARIIWMFIFPFLSSKSFVPTVALNAFFIITDGLMLFFYKKINKLVSFSLLLLEFSIFAIFEALTTNIVSGMELVIYAFIPGIFLFLAEENPSKFYYFANDALCFATTAFLTYLEVKILPPYFLFLPETRSFFIASEFFYTATAIIFLVYGCLITDSSLRFMRRKQDLFNKKINYLVKHDPLTGLMNRHRIGEVFRDCIAEKEKYGTDYAICIFDIDDFKKINDTYGHDAGDYVLQKYTRAVWNYFPVPIRIGRWGGEEFLIIFPRIKEDTLLELETIRAQIASTPIVFNDQEIKVTATYGISSSRNLGSPEEILFDADQCLLEGKRQNKNRIIVSEKF